MGKPKAREKFGIEWETVGDIRKAGVDVPHGIPDQAALTKVEGYSEFKPLAKISKWRGQLELQLTFRCEWPHDLGPARERIA